MTADFDFSMPPFCWLTDQEKAKASRALTLGYYPAGKIIVDINAPSPGLFRVLKGHVLAFLVENNHRQLFSDYHENVVFAVYGLAEQRAIYQYQAAEDCICFLLPRECYLTFINDNTAFAAWFSGALEHKSRAIMQQDKLPELSGMMLSKVGDAPLAQAVWLSPQTSIQEATQRMRDANADAVLTILGSDTGIVTRTDLLEALTIKGLKTDSAIGPIASFPLVSVSEEDLLMQALLVMTQKRIERVAVTHEDGVLALLGLNEILSHFSTHSHVIGLQIARATNIDALIPLSKSLHTLTATLFQHGIHMRELGELIGLLNAQLMEKVFVLCMPKHWQEQSCLVILGSEGRHEQVLRTDQDNALILNQEPDSELSAAAEQFSDHLLAMGYPPCPGGIMIRNSFWRRTHQDWSESIKNWVHKGDPENWMHLALLADAKPIAGNKSLQSHLDSTLKSLSSDKVLMRALATEALAFKSAFTVFGQLRSDRSGVDLKKGGIFPVVHGLRVLSLEHGVRVTNSFERIDALRKLQVLRLAMATNLKQSLAVLMRLRLKQQLNDYQFGHPPENAVYPEKLSQLDRELLRDALRIVEQFKELLKLHYQL